MKFFSIFLRVPSLFLKRFHRSTDLPATYLKCSVTHVEIFSHSMLMNVIHEICAQFVKTRMLLRHYVHEKTVIVILMAVLLSITVINNSNIYDSNAYGSDIINNSNR